MNVAGQHVPRQRILEPALDGPPQRPRAIDRVVALARQVGEGRIGHPQAQARLRQPPREARHQEPDDLAQLRLAERPEDDDLVDAVEELRPEVVAQLLADARPRPRRTPRRRARWPR